MQNIELKRIDEEIVLCNKCKEMVEKFAQSTTISYGKSTDIIILGEAPANNGWRKSGVAWYDINGKLLPSGRVLESLLSIKNLTISDITFLEAIKCYPTNRSNLKQCNINCRQYLYEQLKILKPKLVLVLGDSATKCILDIKYDRFKEIAGNSYFLNIEGINIKIIPIYHPSPISPNSLKGNQKIFKLFDI